MPVVVAFENPEIFYDDGSPVHQVLESNGFPPGSYPIVRDMPPMILLPQLDDDAIGELRGLEGVNVDVQADD
ncbi:hypothetical protein BDV32DRAFT_155333 [Aspergillus pseudonomiae]|uniref:Uncharacterized protein n=1 Tax=Aspergillus pseudonomiae TaxID=1506151 RepID=A0A5N6HKN8_9EURO|nr:uncharacterized protein BDV37DRAFT_289237 [Aspergillus pseudonomiae]KAB8254319.1 hypothetical protein BDV32DRAFT_155333 [Aspergillus pseudonomiae]KAE8397657.1 hypothetical protein BDV37DRAFT_289237 [Aspergillus pseudonomiae]